MTLKTRHVAMLLMAIPSFAAAQVILQSRSYHVVASGQSVKIASFYPVDQNCRSRGTTTANVIRPPQGGTIEVNAGVAYPSYPTTDVRSRCDKQRVPGTLVFYHANSGFFGDDAFVLEIVDPEGRAWRYRYTLSVR